MSYTPRQLHDLARFITGFVLAPGNRERVEATNVRDALSIWDRTTHILDLTLRYDPRVLRFAADVSDVIHQSGHLLGDPDSPVSFETVVKAAASLFGVDPGALRRVTTPEALRQEVVAFVASGDLIEDGKLNRTEGHFAIVGGMTVADPTQVLFAAVARRHFASTSDAAELDPDALYSLIAPEYELA
jgi:hypothetical protein